MSQRKKRWSTLFLLAVWGPILFGAVTYAWICLGEYAQEELGFSLKDAALLGDSYNYANTLFSGLAFAGVILALILHTRELEMQREEIDDTQEIMERAAKSHQESQEALKETTRLQEQRSRASRHVISAFEEIIFPHPSHHLPPIPPIDPAPH